MGGNGCRRQKGWLTTAPAAASCAPSLVIRGVVVAIGIGLGDSVVEGGISPALSEERHGSSLVVAGVVGFGASVPMVLGIHGEDRWHRDRVGMSVFLLSNTLVGVIDCGVGVDKMDDDGPGGDLRAGCCSPGDWKCRRRCCALLGLRCADLV